MSGRSAAGSRWCQGEDSRESWFWLMFGIPAWETRFMATPRQVEANRRNAQLSTGPVTEEGKARSRSNALKHGLAAETLLMPGDESGALTTRIGEWAAALEPRNPHEKWLVELAATES